MSQSEKRVYVVTVSDHHFGTHVTVFESHKIAIDEARKAARELGRDDDYNEVYSDDWLFGATYTHRGDSITVSECILVNEEPQANGDR